VVEELARGPRALSIGRGAGQPRGTPERPGERSRRHTRPDGGEGALDWTAWRKVGWQERNLEDFGFVNLLTAPPNVPAGLVNDPWKRLGAPQSADRPPPPLPSPHALDPIARPEAPQAA
jgi:hypothetical protein